jgi:uncharacterized damage-inducible protein DinB
MEISQFIGGVRKSRAFCLKHLVGMSDAVFESKPNPECKSARETLMHLIAVDRGVLEAVKTAAFPDFFGIIASVQAETATHSRAELEAAASESHEALLGYLQATYGEKTPDDTMPLWGEPTPLGVAIPYLSSEDFYHAGQLGYLRLAAEPTWDYYSQIYG